LGRHVGPFRALTNQAVSADLKRQFKETVIATGIANPDDLVGRLALADWVEEHYLTDDDTRRTIWRLRESRTRWCTVRAVVSAGLGRRSRFLDLRLLFDRTIPKEEIPFNGSRDLFLMYSRVAVADLPRRVRDELVPHGGSRTYDRARGAWVAREPWALESQMTSEPSE
jgi:hypothetical protein